MTVHVTLLKVVDPTRMLFNVTVTFCPAVPVGVHDPRSWVADPLVHVNVPIVLPSEHVAVILFAEVLFTTCENTTWKSVYVYPWVATFTIPVASD
jgi:hypothetical protein